MFFLQIFLKQFLSWCKPKFILDCNHNNKGWSRHNRNNQKRGHPTGHAEPLSPSPVAHRLWLQRGRRCEAGPAARQAHTCGQGHAISHAGPLVNNKKHYFEPKGAAARETQIRAATCFSDNSPESGIRLVLGLNPAYPTELWDPGKLS